MKLRLGKYSIEHDRNYGLLKRTGWSFAYEGHYYVILQKWFLLGLCKFIKEIVTEEKK